MSVTLNRQSVGKPVPRKEGPAKVSGRARYVDDLTFPDMLYGVTVRSTIPRGRIKNVVFGAGINWNELTVVTASDIPGENCVALILDDQPYLAVEFVNHAEEAILLLAHPDKYVVEEARRSITVEYEPNEPVLSLQESLAGQNVIWGSDNTFKTYRVEKGNVDEVWSRAHTVVEREYETGAQEQLYIEPNGMIAMADPENGVTVWGSMQCPYYVHKALMKLFGLPENKVRVVQAETGGGFGGKEEYPSMIAGHAALLAWKSGRPVKIIYDRAEDMVATTKRHPSITRHKTAVDGDGKLLAMEIDFAIDGGAYATLSSVVLSRGTIHAAGPYYCPNVRINSRAMATNTPPHGAFRGFGAPQSIFALERQFDAVANAIGITPEEFRRRNFIRQNETTATSQVIHEAVDLCGLLDRAFDLSSFRKKSEQFAEYNRNSRKIKKGIGFASFMHGAGFTGSGEVYLQSIVGLEGTDKGGVRVLSASTEIGQGTNTIFGQIAADALGIDYDMIEVATPDTGNVPNSGPTVASRTCMVVGKLVESAAIGLRQTLNGAGLLDEVYDSDQFANAVRSYQSQFGPLRSFSQYKPPPGVVWDDKEYRGDAYGAFAWAVYVAEVTVDLVTYETKLDDFVALQEVGRVINPVLAEGQIEGGVAQAIGYSLYEQVVWKDGRMANGQMTNYIMPTAADLPPIRVYFEEMPYAFGPMGAKGIGELPMDGPAPAILSAIENATGIALKSIPVTPEVMMSAYFDSDVDTESQETLAS